MVAREKEVKMFALIEAKGFQFKVQKGDKLLVPFLNVKEGEELEFPVLLVQDKKKVKVGSPYLEDMCVRVRVVRNLKGSKIHVLKFKRRKRYSVLKGHRQLFTEVEVKEIKKKERTS